MIGRQPNLGRVVDSVNGIDPIADLAFVADRVVKDCENRLAIGAVFPVSIASALVPDWADLLKIVIFLGVVRAVVSNVAQLGWVHFKIGRQSGHAAHMFGAG